MLEVIYCLILEVRFVKNGMGDHLCWSLWLERNRIIFKDNK